ncbi:MAG TPA: hypothetical protein VGM19_01245 [Armatimonadota bacterium]|jgi:hypothetical protein
MFPREMLLNLLVVALQGVLLFIMSRGLFVWVLQAFASRHPRRRGGWVVQVVRLPGNLVHELSHAVGFLVCGYRVRRLIPCVADRAGAGACQPGAPWSPLAVPWLATGLAAVAPLVLGALVLSGAAQWLQIPLGAKLSLDAPGRSVLDSFYHSLAALDYRSWHTWLFLYLAFTIGAELAPSSTDVALGIPALLAVGALTAAILLGVYQLAPDAPLRVITVRDVTLALDWLSHLFSFGLLTTGVVVILSFAPVSLLRVARGAG